MSHSDSSKRSPAVAMLATHLPFLDVRLVNIPCLESVRAPEPKGFKSQTVCDLRVTANDLHTRPTEFPDTNNCHVTSRHDKPTSSTTRSETRKSQSRSPDGEATRSLPTKNGHGFNSAPLPCLPCICSVSCAQLSFALEPDIGLCNAHDECACESSLSMSRLVYRLKARGQLHHSVLAICQLTLQKVGSVRSTLPKTVRTRPLRSTSAGRKSQRVRLQCRCPSFSWPSWTPCRTNSTCHFWLDLSTNTRSLG